MEGWTHERTITALEAERDAYKKALEKIRDIFMEAIKDGPARAGYVVAGRMKDVAVACVGHKSVER